MLSFPYRSLKYGNSVLCEIEVMFTRVESILSGEKVAKIPL